MLRNDYFVYRIFFQIPKLKYVCACYGVFLHGLQPEALQKFYATLKKYFDTLQRIDHFVYRIFFQIPKFILKYACAGYGVFLYDLQPKVLLKFCATLKKYFDTLPRNDHFVYRIFFESEICAEVCSDGGWRFSCMIFSRRRC